MGLNISGIAIDYNYNKNLEDLFKDLGRRVVLDKEFKAGDAISTMHDEDSDAFHVCFTEKGTIIFTHFENCMNPWQISGRNCLTFNHHEVSMSMSLNYCESDQMIREVWDLNREDRREKGTPLSIETEGKHLETVIQEKMEEMTGTHYYKLDLNTKAYRLLRDTQGRRVTDPFVNPKEEAKPKEAPRRVRPVEIMAKIQKHIAQPKVNEGIQAMDELRFMFEELQHAGGTVPKLFEFNIDSKVSDKSLKNYILTTAKKWEKGDLASNFNREMQLFTAIVWSRKRIDISDLKDGTFKPKKWWQFY